MAGVKPLLAVRPLWRHRIEASELATLWTCEGAFLLGCAETALHPLRSASGAALRIGSAELQVGRAFVDCPVALEVAWVAHNIGHSSLCVTAYLSEPDAPRPAAQVKLTLILAGHEGHPLVLEPAQREALLRFAAP